MVSTTELSAESLFSTKGHVCLVTGGGTGIGLMYVFLIHQNCSFLTYNRATQALAANGARVYITGRRMDALKNAAETHCPKGNEGGGEIIP